MSYQHLTHDERYQIASGLSLGLSNAQIAGQIGRRRAYGRGRAKRFVNLKSTQQRPRGHPKDALNNRR